MVSGSQSSQLNIWWRIRDIDYTASTLYSPTDYINNNIINIDSVYTVITTPTLSDHTSIMLVVELGGREL